MAQDKNQDQRTYQRMYQGRELDTCTAAEVRIARQFSEHLLAGLPHKEWFQQLPTKERRIMVEGLMLAESKIVAKIVKDADRRARRREQYATKRNQRHAVAEAMQIIHDAQASDTSGE